MLLQVGFGSGFKCNSAVWKATRRIQDGRHTAWAHMKGANLERCWRYVQVRFRVCQDLGSVPCCMPIVLLQLLWISLLMPS